MERSVKQAPRLFDALAIIVRRSKQTPTLHGQIDDVRVVGTCALFGLSVGQSVAQAAGQSRHDLILQLEEVGYVLLEAVGPKMRARFGINELRIDAHPVLIALHRAFEHVADAKLLADLFGVDALALVGEGGVAGDDEAVP